MHAVAPNIVSVLLTSSTCRRGVSTMAMISSAMVASFILSRLIKQLGIACLLVDGTHA